ncbi:PAS/PAC sensor signal transduction histidine kinase [Pseudoduganella namucuonensis]|uniref:Virulence sensor protein BvgS n=2 Tax=Pseudoduganella namucuonensis TaxID=1035707 RepID=A0A1I7J6A1_9BURK|nr:PAS/PAC sensor signal transduction histidine kinase [Pseudoduganella namucuonensis]
MATDFAKLILDETPDAVIVTATDGQVLCWTRGAQAVFGYGEAEALGRALSELTAPPDLAGGDAAIAREALDRGCAYFESLRRGRDGALVYIDGSAKAVVDAAGRATHLLWNLKDVTQLKVLRDAKLLDARFGHVLESTPDAIIMANAGGRVVLATRQAHEMFGYRQGELRGKPLELLMPERFRGPHAAHRDQYFAGPQLRPMGAGRELYGLRKDGGEFPVEISLSPIRTEEGTLIMSAIRDITERKRIEQALQEKNVELGNANQAKDRFLASMSHELRTPLNAIIGFTGTMLMKLPGPINVEQERQLRTIQGSARHLLSLINDLLDLTKIASGKVELNAETLGCHELIAELLGVYRPQAQHKGLTLDYAAPERPVRVCCDRRALAQIVGNLLNNAIKFTDAGHVRVALGRAEVDGRRCATVSISDTGVGIAQQEQDMLFQAFSQIDNGSTRQFEGTGLGLHLSQKLAQLLDGRIMFESRYGEGSVFTLAVPLQEMN